MAIRTLTPADMANPTPVLAAIPSGTAVDRQVVSLPPGEFETDLVLEVVGKRFWSLIGGPTTLHFPTYGPASNDGMYERRHSRFGELSDFYVGGLKIHGPHKVRSAEYPTRAQYDSTKAFQHGFVIAYSQRVVMEDVEAFEIGGDGLYLNAATDVQILGLRIEFNGRQGIGGIDGDRWLFEKVNIVNSARNAIDFEPIGRRPGTLDLRWIAGVTVRDSELNGGVTLHRVSDITLDRNRIRGGKILAVNSGDLLAQRRSGIRIINNVWPEKWRSGSANTGPIQFMSVNGAEVTGNTCHRDPTDTHTAEAPFVEMRAVPSTGHVTVRGNDTSGFMEVFKWRDGLIPSPTVTTDIQPVPSETSQGEPVTMYPIRQQISHFLTGTTISAELRVPPVEGNVVFVAFSAATTLTNMGGFAGYTKAVEKEGAGVSVQVWFKRAGASEPSIVTGTSTVSKALKIHVFEAPSELFSPGDLLDVTATAAAGPVNTLTVGPVTPSQDVFTVTAIAALGGGVDFQLDHWDSSEALADFDTTGLMVSWGTGGSATATWNQVAAPTAHQTAGVLAAFKTVGPVTPISPRRVSAGRSSTTRNTTGTVNTDAQFPVLAGKTYLAFVAASKNGGVFFNAVIPPSHGGLVWALETSLWMGKARRLHLFKATSPTDLPADQISLTTVETGAAFWWTVIETEGAILQTATAKQPGGTFMEATFPAPPLEDSDCFGFCLHGLRERQLVDADPIHLLLAESNVAENGGQRATTDWAVGDQTFRWDWASVIHGLAITVEVG